MTTPPSIALRPPTGHAKKHHNQWAKPLLCLFFAVANYLIPSSAEAKKNIPSSDETSSYALHEGVQRFADDVAERRNLDPATVRALLAQARKLPRVQQLMRPAPVATAKNWAAYRSRFIEPVRIKAGLAFWRSHERWLDLAQAQTGVPAAVVVGILGVETLYGRHMGGFRTLDALTTLAFDFPTEHPRAAQRAAYFKDELEQLLSLTQRSGLDATTLRGSYAGALGWPQFMPSSWARHAVDFDGDGKVDLINSPADAIGSVAQYLKAYGWKPGMPTHYAVQLSANAQALETLLAPDILPTFSAAALQIQGAELSPEAKEHAGPLALVEVFNGDALPSYVVGTENFYVVTRYNWSSYYALAVIELGQTLALLRQGQPAPTSLAAPRAPQASR